MVSVDNDDVLNAIVKDILEHDDNGDFTGFTEDSLKRFYRDLWVKTILYKKENNNNLSTTQEEIWFAKINLYRCYHD